MAFSRPTDKPRWTGIVSSGAFVDNDIADGPTGGLNVIEPSEAKKDAGWGFEEFPPRNWFNWLLRKIASWIYWLDQQEQGHETRIALNDNVRNDYDDASLRADDNAFEALLTSGINNIVGLTIERPSSSTITINAGACGAGASFAGHVGAFFLYAPKTGTIASMLPPSHAAVANSTWYHIFLCIDPLDPTNTDVFLDTDINGATILADVANLTVRRCIGSVYNDAGGNILDFVQQDDLFLFKQGVLGTTGAIASGSPVTRVVRSPLDMHARAIVSLQATDATLGALLSYWDGILGTSGLGGHIKISDASTPAGSYSASIEFQVVTDLLSQMYLEPSGASGGIDYVSYYTRGFFHPRGRV